MNAWQKIVAGALVALFVLVTWMGRYDMQAIPAGGQGTGGMAYVLDRWTGTAHVLFPSSRRELKEAAQ